MQISVIVSFKKIYFEDKTKLNPPSISSDIYL